MIRKANTILSIGLILIFVFHTLMGSFTLLGLTQTAIKTLAWIGVAVMLVHVFIGAYLTAGTLRAQEQPARRYWRENSLFWVRRISGLAILVLMMFHFGTYGRMEGQEYVAFPFTTVKLAAQLLLAAALFVHIFVNVRPLLVSMGIIRYKERRRDIFLLLTAALPRITRAETMQRPYERITAAPQVKLTMIQMTIILRIMMI